MKTPICDFVKKYSDSKKIRLHMPGHKGTGHLGCGNYDITEIDGADVLYSSDGIILESENNASDIFGTGKTLYSAEGSSLAIRAMLFLIKAYALSEKRNFIVAAGRNAHKSFVTASALSGAEVEWIFPDKNESLISCKITSAVLESFFEKAAGKPVAVYITSPDYLGNISDISSLASVCHRHKALLIVDNAHGSYLHFLKKSLHPITLGADMCCDSAHKTLPVLTGGAYLHISKSAPELLSLQAEDAMSLFASTSPSYLILQSLDMANRYLAEDFPQKIRAVSQRADKLKETLKNAGYCITGDEPLKLTIMPKSYGYTGAFLADYLSQQNIECEFSDPDYAVMMFSSNTCLHDIDLLEKALLKLEQKAPVLIAPPGSLKCEKAMSLAEALFSPNEEAEVCNCEGRILSSPSVGCPPAIPIVMCGEIINSDAIKCFEYYGIKKCKIVKIK